MAAPKTVEPRQRVASPWRAPRQPHLVNKKVKVFSDPQFDVVSIVNKNVNFQIY